MALLPSQVGGEQELGNVVGGQTGQTIQALNPINVLNELFSGAQNNFQATAAPIQQGFTQDQINQAYNQSQMGLGQQQAFIQALQAQNGTLNQSNILGQQQQLANQLQQQSTGQGPNPAQAALAQNTAANTANQAALMAGQRGSSSNVGLMARQAAQQGAANQQNSVGQAATLQAQQQLAAQQALAQQQAQMQGVAGNQVNQQASAIGNFNTAAQNQQGMLLNANSQYNNALVNQQNSMNQVNAGVAGQNASTNKGLLGGVLGGIGSAVSSIFYNGGMAGYADGGQVSSNGPQSMLGQMLANNMNVSSQMANAQPQTTNFSMPDNSQSSSSGGGAGALGLLALLNQGGSVKTMVKGGHVPGNAQVKGNSPKNDTVPAMLSPGEIVIPRSALTGPNAGDKAKKFVEAVLSRHGKLR